MNDGLPILDSVLMYFLAIAIAFLVAAVIKGIVHLTGQVGQSQAKAAPPPVPAAVPVGVPPEHVAAIGAAIASFLGAHRIVHIEDAGHGVAWSAAGRTQHQTSHQPHGAPH